MSQTVEQHCCAHAAAEPVVEKSATASVAALRVVRRILGILKMVTPAAIWVILPKCPLCIVGYAAAAGIGLSVSTAANLRILAVFTCLGLLVLFAARQIYLLRRYLPGRWSQFPRSAGEIRLGGRE